MNEQNTRYLKERYPRLYSEIFAFECGDGWLNLLDRLSAAIEAECRRLVAEDGLPEDKLPIAEQVKEKFGSLRFYMDTWSKSIDDLVDAASEESESTCDYCGKPGSVLNDSGWFHVMCGACEQASVAMRRSISSIAI